MEIDKVIPKTPKITKYEANIFPSSIDNEYFSSIEFTTRSFAIFLIHVEKLLKDFPQEDKPYAIIFKPNSEDALFKVYPSDLYGYIIEDLT